MEINFIDKKEREIIISLVDNDINAFYKDKKIGEISFDYVEKDLGCRGYIEHITRLYYMHVDSGFRKAGIASKMIELAVEYHGDFLRPKLNSVGGRDKECYEYYTPEGKALIESCIRNKIFKDDLDEGFDE
ncbi:hypothetical protein RMB12_14425 [Acinetobacter sp. V117_2]|uniref:hypothetical protein n=1 Tax=Acinetobacter sp. V117_2 TaxID=3072989 RepID=UPI00287DB5C5|nr:hypothetical protein [Acinetobacter sp. V117_2]MDS7968216.1 hypothetical protein [Acinetobacter sp. V117_2]